MTTFRKNLCNDHTSQDNLSIFRVLDIVRGTTVDGPGFRTSIYLAGCNHHCKGCHNPQSWNPDGGTEMTLDEIMEIVTEEDFNVTLSGGDPLFNPDKAELLAKEITRKGYSVWLYTGYEWEEINADPALLKVMKYIDTVVTGRYIESLRSPDLPFRGSSNQQLINPNERSHH